MEYTLGMQVLQALSDIQSQAEPDRPGEGFRRAEQLFQGSPIHILGQSGRRRGMNVKVSVGTLVSHL